MDTKNTLCPICNTADKLYIDSNDKGETRFCLNCGYQTHSKFKIGAPELEQYESNNPKLVNALRKEDKETGQCWFPAVITLGNLGIIFPDGTGVEEWKWGFARVVSIPIFERVNFPIADKEGEFYESRLDIENAIHFNTFAEVQNHIQSLTKPE